MQVSAKEFAAKYADKPEVYKFVAHDCGIYVPPYDNVTVWHLRDLACSKRRRIYGKDVKHLMVPQYEGLAIRHLLAFGGDYESVVLSLPSVQKEVLKMPR